jgi:hypothetical protein
LNYGWKSDALWGPEINKWKAYSTNFNLLESLHKLFKFFLFCLHYKLKSFIIKKIVTILHQPLLFSRTRFFFSSLIKDKNLLYTSVLYWNKMSTILIEKLLYSTFFFPTLILFNNLFYQISLEIHFAIDSANLWSTKFCETFMELWNLETLIDTCTKKSITYLFYVRKYFSIYHSKR